MQVCDRARKATVAPAFDALLEGGPEVRRDEPKDAASIHGAFSGQPRGERLGGLDKKIGFAEIRIGLLQAVERGFGLCQHRRRRRRARLTERWIREDAAAKLLLVAEHEFALVALQQGTDALEQLRPKISHHFSRPLP